MREIFTRKLVLLLSSLLLISQCSSKKPETDIPSKRELRGVWIASVANIDWPSDKNMGSIQQQQEFVNILNNHQKVGINAVFVQVRAASDAFYSLSDEPWSEWLTGKQGRAPSPYYDPMMFMIEHAHERNMEFHAWLNLNRGTHKSGNSVSENHITKIYPQWFLNYGGNKVYNFGIPEVRRYITNIVVNIIRNYDVDGIHFDDYFYPYPTPGQKINDTETFRKYGQGFKRIEDWRRNNINLLIKEISEAISREKPYVKFGVSPFGVWRSTDRDREGSRTSGALSSYDDLFADSRYWAQQGWIDYIVPQIYFSFGHRTVPYKDMVEWWTRNCGNHHLYIGLGSYRIGENSKEWASASQILRQIRLNEKTPKVEGSVFYSSKSLMPSRHRLDDSLKRQYQCKALVPLMPWKQPFSLPQPEIVALKKNNRNRVLIQWEIPENYEANVRSFAIYRFARGERKTLDNPRNIIAIVRNHDDKSYIDDTINAREDYEYAITALDRLSNESKPSKLHKLR